MRAVTVLAAVLGIFVPRAIHSLDQSKKPAGADHKAAHAKTKGKNVPAGVIEVGGGVNTKHHLGTRLKDNLDYNGTAAPCPALPAATAVTDDHATLVSDVLASGDGVYTGVGAEALIHAGYVPGTKDEWTAHDCFEQRRSVSVFNNSWKDGTNDNAASQKALFMEWFVRARDVVVVFAAANDADGWGNKDSQVGRPADALNVITVGAVDEKFIRRADYASYWLSGDDGTNPDIRGKPDIVAPGGNYIQHDGSKIDGIENAANGDAKKIESDGTSFAAPHVSGVITLLIERGLVLGDNTKRNHLAHKAIILNSARKRFIVKPHDENAAASDNAATDTEASDFDYLDAAGKLRAGGTGDLSTPKTAEWTPTQWIYDDTTPLFVATKPLDDELGTGVLDAERALAQHAAGKQAPGKVNVMGWNRDAMKPTDSEDVYRIDAVVKAGTFITATLVWDRRVNNSDGNTVKKTSMFSDEATGVGAFPNFDLRIYKQGKGVPFANSSGAGSAAHGTASENVEHLHVPVPETGQYEIRVLLAGTTNEDIDYALAWWTAPAPAKTGNKHFKRKADGPPFAMNELQQSHPNPFNPSTTIRFSVAETRHVSLAIFDAAGRHIRTLVDGAREAGRIHAITWNGRDDRGEAVASGVYFYRMVAGDFTETRKLVLIR